MTTITNTFGKLKEIEEVISLFHDDMTLMFGGFGGIGSPPSLIQAVLDKGITNLNLIGNDTGFPDVGIGRLVTNERVKSLVTSHIGSNPNAGRQLN
ncbi:MAG: CoA-transferase, partial [Bacillus mycoides]